jgi:hypothetical protein
LLLHIRPPGRRRCVVGGVGQVSGFLAGGRPTSLLASAGFLRAFGGAT